MKHAKKMKVAGRRKRAKRVRKKVYGTAERPRMSVSRSNTSVYVQLIDDDKGVTVAGVSSLAPEIREKKFEESGKTPVAMAVGELIASKAKEKGVERIVFDRNGYLYHGRVKAVADGARKGGLKF